MVTLIMFVMVIMFMTVVDTEYENGGTIDQQTQYRYEDCRIEGDTDWINQPQHTFPGHHRCKHSEQYRPRVTAQGIHLAGAKTVALAVGMAPGVDVGEGIDAKRHRVGAHVQAVCQQGHGTEGDASRDFHYHHGRGDTYYDECAKFTGPDPVLSEGMAMLPPV